MTCVQDARGLECSHISLDLTNSSPPLFTVVLQIVKKVELEAQRAKGPTEAKGGRRRRNPVEDLKREVAIMRTLRHKNIVSLQVGHSLPCVLACLCLPASQTPECRNCCCYACFACLPIRYQSGGLLAALPACWPSLLTSRMLQ